MAQFLHVWVQSNSGAGEITIQGEFDETWGMQLAFSPAGTTHLGHPGIRLATNQVIWDVRTPGTNVGICVRFQNASNDANSISHPNGMVVNRSVSNSSF